MPVNDPLRHRVLIVLALLMAVLAVPARVLHAQASAAAKPASRATPVSEPPATAQAPAKPAAAPAAAHAADTEPEPDRRRNPESKHPVKLDVRISDQTGSAGPVVRTFTLVAATQRRSSFRSMVTLRGVVKNPAEAGPPPDQEQLPYYGDVTVQFVDSTRLEVSLVLNYRSLSEPLNDGNTVRGATVTETLWTIVQDGKPQVVFQAADPVLQRNISVELTATILR